MRNAKDLGFEDLVQASGDFYVGCGDEYSDWWRRCLRGTCLNLIDCTCLGRASCRGIK